MLTVTTDSIAGHEVVETLGLVRGNTIRARHIGADIAAAFRTVVGGEIPEYTRMMAGAREQALDRMVAEARSIGADAVVEMRITTSTVMKGAAEIVCYGTAVRLAPKPA
ncbi:MAG: YbjQ family protein [Pseudomonadota bacterium]|nr:YbjQ family protein [Pseudomonadota bacterium]